MTDEYINKKDVVDLGVMMQTHLWTREQTYNAIFCLPSADVAPVRHEEDGTLWVTVGDCEKVGRVIVKNEQGHFCRVFYMCDGDEESVRHGEWEEVRFRTIPYNRIAKAKKCSSCGKRKDKYVVWNYCPSCGAKMDEGGTDGTDDC